MDNTTYQREWFRKHADRINEKRRQKVVCPTCQKLFNKSSLRKHALYEEKNDIVSIVGTVWKNVLSFEKNDNV